MLERRTRRANTAARGYGLDLEGTIPDVSGIAIPIHDAGRAVDSPVRPLKPSLTRIDGT